MGFQRPFPQLVSLPDFWTINRIPFFLVDSSLLAHEALQSAGAANSSVALLLDGPKGRVAVRMAEVGQTRWCLMSFHVPEMRTCIISCWILIMFHQLVAPEDALRRYPGLSVAAIHDVPRLDPRYRDEEGRCGNQEKTWAMKKRAPWLFRLYRGWNSTQLYGEFNFRQYKDPYKL